MQDPQVTVDEGLFRVYGEDLDRLVRWIGRMGAAQSLTTLVRRFTRGRLRYGPATDAAPLPAWWDPEPVRLWDPAKAWHEGDSALFTEPDVHLRHRRGPGGPCFGEIVRVQGLGAMVRIDGAPRIMRYGTAATKGSAPAVLAWRRSVEAMALASADRQSGPAMGAADGRESVLDDEARIDQVLWTHGERIFGALLGALRHDARFVALQGRWFVRSMATRPTADQLAGLAWSLLTDADGPLAVEDLVRMVPPPSIEGDAALFGLALALDERPEMFMRVAGGPRSRWTLIQPPPGHYVARLAAYDPETGAVLCEPGEVLGADTVARLWALDLLRAVISR